MERWLNLKQYYYLRNSDFIGVPSVLRFLLFQTTHAEDIHLSKAGEV